MQGEESKEEVKRERMPPPMLARAETSLHNLPLFGMVEVKQVSVKFS
jgi:hypothetical protein